MDNRAVGVFDSGLGGLTAVRVLRRMLPDENIIYFGDTGRMPYGGRPASQIVEIARQNLDFVASFGVKAVLAACGTISSNAADLLDENEIHAIGVLRPGVRELCALGRKRLGVIATATSIQSGAFEREIHKLAPEAQVTALACPRFVPMIESGHFAPDDKDVRRVVAETLLPLNEAGVEALLLGCTHYGIISEAIQAYLGEDVALIGAADAAARELARYLEENAMLAEQGGEEKYYTSGDTAAFTELAPIMLAGKMRGGLEYIEPFPLKG